MNQSFEDFILGLPPEDRHKFIEEFIANLALAQKSVLKRTTLKLSTDLSDEEVRKTISEVTGTPIEEIPRIDFKAEKSKIKDDSKRVEKIIGDYKAKLKSCSNVTQDKHEELFDLGKFLDAMNGNFNIYVPEEI